MHACAFISSLFQISTLFVKCVCGAHCNEMCFASHCTINGMYFASFVFTKSMLQVFIVVRMELIREVVAMLAVAV